jgi:hypothetical protein
VAAFPFQVIVPLSQESNGLGNSIGCPITIQVIARVEHCPQGPFSITSDLVQSHPEVREWTLRDTNVSPLRLPGRRQSNHRSYDDRRANP